MDNVHSDAGGDFSEVERIRQSGALIIGTYDRFSYGEPKAFIELINSHMQRKTENEVIFVEGTGHVYTKREQMLANIILNLVKKVAGRNKAYRCILVLQLVRYVVI